MKGIKTKIKNLLCIAASAICAVSAAFAIGLSSNVEASAQTTKITEDLVIATGATVTTATNGETVDAAAGTAYSGEIPYILKGDSALEFTFPNDRARGWKSDGYALNFTYDICDLGGNSVFQVVYKSDRMYTAAYVAYGTEIRTFTYHLNADPWYNPDGFYQYKVPGYAYGYHSPLMFGDGGVSKMEIKLVDDVVQVWATYDMSKGSGTDLMQVMIAAFDGSDVGFTVPTTFVKAADFTAWGLPKVYDRIKDGYKIEFSSTNVSSTNEQVDVDVNFLSLTAESAVSSLNMPKIEIGAHENYDYCGIGSKIEIPAATWTSTTSTTPAAVEQIVVKTPSGGEVPVTAGSTYEVTEAGKHRVEYKVESSIAYFEFTAKETAVSLEDIFSVTDATKSFVSASDGKGLRISSDTAYAGEINAIFNGDTEFTFDFPETYDSFYNGDFVFRFTDAKDDSKYFEVIYTVAGKWGNDGYTGAHVKYDGYFRSSRYWGTEWYDTQTTASETVYCGPSFLTHSYGTNDIDGRLALDWDENGVLSVSVSSFRDVSSMRVIAAFDGTDSFVSGTSWGWPKMGFENGFKVSFSSSFTGSATDAGTDVCFKSIKTGGATLALAQKYIDGEYAFEAQFNEIGQEGADLYVPCGEEIGSVTGQYSIMIGNAKLLTVKEVEIDVTADTSTVGAKKLTVTDDALAEIWKEATAEYTLNVETAYKVTFDTNGGFAMDPIVYSEHTKDRVVIGDAEKLFWKFDGWYEGTTKFDGDVTKLYERNVTLKAAWVDVTAPTVALNGVNDVTVAVKNTSTVISVSDVKAGDAAQNDSVTVSIEVKTPSGSFTAVQDGYTLNLTETGTYEIRYTVKDAANLTSSIVREIDVIERTSPVLTVSGEYTTSVYVGGSVAVASVTAKDADNAALTVVVTVTKDGEKVEVKNGAFVATETGVYTVTYTAKDGYDLTGIYTYEVSVKVDDEKPVITVDFADQRVSKGASVTVPTASVTDNVAEGVTLEVKVAYGTQAIALENGAFVAEQDGVYTVTFTAKDKAGNTTEKIVYITVNGEITDGNGDDGNDGGCGSVIVGVPMVAVAGLALIAFKRKKKENN